MKESSDTPGLSVMIRMSLYFYPKVEEKSFLSANVVPY